VSATLTGHSKKVSAVQFHPTEDIVLTCSYDKTAKVWKPTDRALPHPTDSSRQKALIRKKYKRASVTVPVHQWDAAAAVAGRVSTGGPSLA
jgi:WD40 repeat protein